MSGGGPDEGVERPYLRVANVQDGFLDLEDIKSVRVSRSDAARFRLRAGDLLVLEGNGNPANLGRGSLWGGEIEGCLHQNHVHVVRPSRRLLPEYLAALMRTEWARHYFTGGADQVSIATLSQDRLGNLPLPLPDVREQARRLEVLAVEERAGRALMSALRRQLMLLQEHRQALITAAVTGRMDVPGVAA